MSPKKPVKPSPFTPEFDALPKPYRPPVRVTMDEYDRLPIEDRRKFDRVDDLSVEFLDDCQFYATEITRALSTVLDKAHLGGPDPQHTTRTEDGTRYVYAQNNRQLTSGPLYLEFNPVPVDFSDDPFQSTAEALRDVADRLNRAAETVLQSRPAKREVPHVQ